MKIGIVSPVCPYGEDGGHAARVRRLYEELSVDHEVWILFAPFRWQPPNPVSVELLGERLQLYPKRLSWCRKLFRRVATRIGFYRKRLPSSSYKPVDHFCPFLLPLVVRKFAREQQLDTVIAEYVFLSKGLTFLPASIRRVIDTHDLFGDRYKCLDPDSILSWPWAVANLKPEEEARCLRRANAVLAIQADEASSLRGLGVDQCYVVPHLLPSSLLGKSTVEPSRKEIFHFSSYWQPNVHGVRWFIREVLPLLRKEEPGLCLVLYGSICKAIEPADGVELRGFVNDLRRELGPEKVMISPVFLGTGLNIKVIEMLSWGCPMVATSASFRGLELKEEVKRLIADDPVEFCDKVISLLRDAQQREAVSKLAILTADQIYGNAKSELAKALAA